MASKLRFLRLILLVASFSFHAHGQSSVTGIWHIGPAQASLEGSVVTSYTTVDRVGETFVITYSVACPSAISPENDACRDLNIYPAEVYHTQGSVWGGILTNRAEEHTTAWICSLGDCGNCPGGGEVRCRETITAGGSTVTTSRNVTGICHVLEGSVPLVITAGVEKLQPYHTQMGMSFDVTGLLSAVRTSIYLFTFLAFLFLSSRELHPS